MLKAAPDGYPELELDSGVRTPREILSHMTSVLGSVYARLTQTERERFPLKNWQAEVDRFYGLLSRIDEVLATGATLEAGESDLFLQGPLADTLTHIGQLAMMRRVAGAPVPGENYMKAKIEIGRVGIDQGEPEVPE